MADDLHLRAAGKRTIPALVHVRPAKGRASLPPESALPHSAAVPSSDDVSTRAVPVDVVRRELQSGLLPKETEVLFAGLGDWTPADRIPELWIAPAPAPVDAGPHDAIADGAELPLSVPASRAADSSEPKRRGFGALAIVGAVGGALALLLLGAGAVYFVYFHYTPVAIKHLPKKCTVAARVDFVDWAFFKPFTERVVPAIEEATRPPPSPIPTPAGPSLKERLLASAGINLDRDVRELALCVFQDTSAPTPSSSGKPVADPLFGFRGVVALGGRIRRGAIPGLYEAIRTEGWASALRLEGTGDSAVLRVAPPIGGVIGQADDGTLLYAPSDAKLAEVREGVSEDDAMDATGLRKKGAFELVLGHLIFATAGTMTPTAALDAATLDALSKVQQGRLGLDLGRSPRIELSLDGRAEAEAKGAEAAVRRLLDEAQKALSGASTDYAGEHGALSGAKLARTDNLVELRLDFPFSDVDRGAASLADALKDPKSNLRSKVLPTMLFAAGAGPMPPGLAPSASASALPSGSASSGAYPVPTVGHE